MKFKKIISSFLLFTILFCNSEVIFAANEISAEQKYPCYNELYLSEDKYENFNRKMFDFNLKMNNIFLKKIHMVWASVVPNFVINALNHAYSNIEYPKRLVSSLLQKDFDAMKHETKRFLINTTIGALGLIDVAFKVFDLEMYNEDMEQAFAKYKMCLGDYLVLPFVSSTTSRDALGRIFDFALNPTTYIASPIAAIVKMGLLINRTSQIQPIVKMVQSSFIDPYDVARKFFGINKHIKLSNYDRKKVLENLKDDYDEVELVDNKNEEVLSVKGAVQTKSENLVVNEVQHDELIADIVLNNYNPQNPVLDSIRTALFELDENKKQFWSELSIWNRNFSKRIKTSSVEVSKNRDKYNFRYVLQKDKKSPLAILFPSVGEGIYNHHSEILAKIFYDEGYSVLIVGSHFQWEFLKSIEKGHKLGVIKDDVKYINLLVNNAVNYLQDKYDRVFLNRVALGTSLGAYAVLFLANEQYQIGAQNIDKFIAICPPVELTYAMGQLDKVISSWKNYPNDFKEKVAITSSKVMRAYKDVKNNKTFDTLPFTPYEGKLMSAFVFHQKLSDLVYETERENNPNFTKKEFYKTIYNQNYDDYMKKYILVNRSYDELKASTDVHSISDYLINSKNYRIFHSLDDYLTNTKQLKKLKSYCDDKLTLFSNGAHLGFLYRNEFLEALKNEIQLSPILDNTIGGLQVPLIVTEN